MLYFLFNHILCNKGLVLTKGLQKTLFTTKTFAYAFFKIFTFFVDYSQFYLGYAKLLLCSLQKIGSVFTWSIAQGAVTRAFHPGIAPANLDKVSDSGPLSSYKGELNQLKNQELLVVTNCIFLDRLGPGSSITLTVFDSTFEKLLES